MYETDVLTQKREIVKMVYETGIAAHMSPAMAMLEILNVLIRDIMNVDAGIDDEASDKLVLSNGHTALALYAVYLTIGFISKDEFYTYKKKDSRLGVHQDRNHTPGTLISTGSLGHGLPNAVGVAYAWKLQGKNNRIYVTVGDGELNEGSIWESVIFAARMKLDNVCCIIDDNKSTDYMPDIVEKFAAFGWNAVRIDGHNEDEIRNALKEMPSGSPYAVVADTVKGHGVGIFESNHAEWHEKKITDEEYSIIMEDLI
jgi:transketolase